MKNLLWLVGITLLFFSCSEDDAGFGSSYADNDNIIDDNGYAKLEKIRFAVNPKITLPEIGSGYVGIQKVISAQMRINSKFWGTVDTQTITYNSPSLFPINGKNYFTYPPNMSITIQGLKELADTAAVEDYYEYLHGNIKPGEHLFSIEKLKILDINGDTMTIEINKAGMLKVRQDEREKFIGIFEGDV